MKIAFLFFTLLLTSQLCVSQEIKKITWTDLKVEVKFDDPFKKLTGEQLSNLTKIARYRDKKAQPDFAPSKEEKSKIDSLEQVLNTENVNVDSLISIRYVIADLRRKNAEAMDTTLHQTMVSISGYILPLTFEDEKVSDFLLVPWVGACIHSPPPPKNQIIFIKSEVGIKLNTRFQAVTVKGLLTIENTQSDLFLVDGRAKISSGYAILDAQITEYKD